ncbi:hypothetical protein [Salinivibrio proteolyticus]|nr:hypothetical protein [Salinivibrio proteolyticus]
MDLYEKAVKEEEALQKQVFVADDHVVINVSYEYNIALSRCDTP